MMVSEASSNEMPDSVQQSSLQQIQAVGKEDLATEKMELLIKRDSVNTDEEGIPDASCDSTLNQTPSGNESPPSKLRYGRIRNGRVSRKRMNKRNSKVSPKANGHNGEEQESIVVSQSSPKSSENRLPTLRLIKRPKKQLSSSESYFIGTDTKEYTTQLHQDSQEVRRVSPLSLYTKVDGSKITHVACKRYKRRPIHEEPIPSPKNATSQCDNGSKEDEENDVSRLVSEIVMQIVEDEINDVRRLNLEQPGSKEQEILQQFCLENKMDYEDFSDLRVFTISPLAKEDLSETSEYAQVPKKRRRYEKSPTASPIPPPHSPSPSSYDTRLRKRKVTTPPPSLSTLKSILTRSESKKQKKDDNLDLSEDTQKSEDIRITVEEVTSSKEEEELPIIKEEEKEEIPEPSETSAPVKEPICVVDEPCKVENISDIPTQPCPEPQVTSPSILKSSLQPSPSSSPEIISQHSCSSESSTSTTTRPDIAPPPSKSTGDTPLDLTTCKSALDLAATKHIHRTPILNAIPKPSTHQPIFNSPNKTNSSSSSNSKRSLTVKKLLSLGRERQKSKPSPLTQEIMNNSSFNARSLMEQLSSGKMSLEDESILRGLLLDSSKGDLDISSANPALFQALNSKSPDNNIVDNKSDPCLTEFLNDPIIHNNAELMNKIKKLKKEIICLELMAEQKDKERVAIICFKKYKEEQLRRFLKRHTSNQSKEKYPPIVGSGGIGNGRPAPNIGFKQPFPQREPIPKPMESMMVQPETKVEETPRSEPLNLHLSPLMFRLSNNSPGPRPRVPSIRPPNQCSALKEQLLAKPKPIAPKPTETRRGTPQPRPSPASQHSILTSCLQAPVRNPYPMNWLAQPELPVSRKSSSPPEHTTNESHQCSQCNTKNASFLCSGCQKDWYCSPRCQMIKWPTHAPSCLHTGATASKNS